MNQTTIDKHAQRVWSTFCEIYPKIVKYDCPKIVLCNRLRVTLGKCYYWENKIHLANKLFGVCPKLMISDILPHEIAHQVSYRLYGAAKQEKSCHGIEWQEIMLSYGIFPHVTYTFIRE